MYHVIIKDMTLTPKEKAIELVNKYWDSLYEVSGDIEYIGTQSKQCALIAVDEIIESHSLLGKKMFEIVGTDSYQDRCLNYDRGQYWQEVKKEINKL